MTTSILHSCDSNNPSEDGLYARIFTNKGNILLKLEFEKTPMTVANFVGLAQGSIENKNKKKGDPYYDGLNFHRVIENFMIQGGDPQGNGSGDPGYSFPDEFDKSLRHDKPGILSMANSGPNTNGSQFFITHVPTPWLDDKHTVFGNIADSISQKTVDVITQGDKIEKIEIIRVGDLSKKFDAAKVFKEKVDSLNDKNKQASNLDMEDWKSGFTTTESGLKYAINQKGSGKEVKKGDTVSVHYSLFLENGEKIDSSLDRGEAFETEVGVGRVIKGWDEGLTLLKEGDKAKFIIPSELGYGSQGAGGSIPANATLYFEVELLKVL
ncbi:peptidylprolyl isomerase [Ichthyobacterium seriolicida]|nr:peptidylprolyl isomerase [Ichthyobacterium seriolicida]